MAHPGTAHKYTSRLLAFEHLPPHTTTTTTTPPPNTLLFIAGLGDGLLTVPYPSHIAQSLPPHWRIAEILLSSSYTGWGTGSLARDVQEISECVSYFRRLRPGAKIVLLGHSTGCQDIMEYLVGPEEHGQRPPLDGIILQGGVSDREAWASVFSGEEKAHFFVDAVRRAEDMIRDGKGMEILGAQENELLLEFGVPVTASRVYSLLAKGGDDDYFSSDLSDACLQKTFGRVPQRVPVCFLLGELDPHVPAHVDKEALLSRFSRIVREGSGVVDEEHGGVIPGAHHNLEGDPEHVVQDLVKRVCGFVERFG
ncbi:DUF1749-domain-containing protein [Decorospora gaudefroyi]|uniref:DUF1749-domain-containing protein n=1 Tax=Decorospora gaudefroyi TaxID=184978 RepID=A0A6A5KJI5_9PLEO|nr:DUF1749-domain-containing protein [Decorospora gaudefroyi]